MKNGTTLWDLIKTILGYFFTKREENKEAEKIESEKIEQTLNNGYQKIDDKKEEQKKDEDLNNVQDDLNNIF